MEKLEWTALEYEEREREQDWFWALGIIVITSSLASIIYSNYFFAILIILSGILLGFFAQQKPDMISYELNEKGLRIATRLYPYENIKSFYIQIDHSEEITMKSILLIKSERAFMPILSIPIEKSSVTQIKSILLSKNVIEEEMKEHIPEKIMDFFGF
jgi:hypothetical protein